MKRAYLTLIKFYKVFSAPIYSAMPGYAGCRFWPTCSDYSREAVEKFGIGKGLVMTAKRLLRCNSLFEGGIDRA